jgi:hypothetical protein
MSIVINGSTRRSFIFPADLRTSMAYFYNTGRILQYLPHISMLQAYSPTCYRMMYHTTELGVYKVRITCDLEVSLDEEEQVLRFTSLEGYAPVEVEAGWNSISAQGIYTSESRFHDEGEHTRIVYSLRLQAELPVPLAALVLLPSVRDRIANSITTWRMREIADGFIERSILEYNRNGNAA